MPGWHAILAAPAVDDGAGREDGCQRREVRSGGYVVFDVSRVDAHPPWVDGKPNVLPTQAIAHPSLADHDEALVLLAPSQLSERPLGGLGQLDAPWHSVRVEAEDYAVGFDHELARGVDVQHASACDVRQLRAATGAPGGQVDTADDCAILVCEHDVRRDTVRQRDELRDLAPRHRPPERHERHRPGRQVAEPQRDAHQVEPPHAGQSEREREHDRTSRHPPAPHAGQVTSRPPRMTAPRWAGARQGPTCPPGVSCRPWTRSLRRRCDC